MGNSNAGPVAEWQVQHTVVLAWPPAESDWRDDLEAIRSTYMELIHAITDYQTLWLLHRPEEGKALAARLQQAGIDQRRVELIGVDFDDTWLRDTAPLSVRSDGQAFHLNFVFDGWGGKYPAERDNALGERLLQRLEDGLHLPQQRHPLVAEGGALESDGCGRVLTTRSWLKARYHDDSETIDQLRQALRADELLIIEHGALPGDDTDGHIDNLVRLVQPDSIVYQQSGKPGTTGYDELQAMEQQVKTLCTRDGEAYRQFALPWPGPIQHRGRELPASYANFLLINGAVLVPQFEVESDKQALTVMRQACPGRDVIGIDARCLIRQNGGIHCASMQFAEIRGANGASGL
jgi:agmatine/peptidylarginine deiminase